MPGSAVSWAPVLLAACLLGLTVWHLRRSPDPLVPLGLLRSRAVAGANLTALMLTATTTPAIYLSTVYVLAIVTPLAAATNGNLMDGYRIGFFGTCAIALAGLLPSLLISPTGRSVGRRPRSDRDSGEAPVAADPNTEQAPGPWTGQLASPEPMTEPDRSR